MSMYNLGKITSESGVKEHSANETIRNYLQNAGWQEVGLGYWVTSKDGFSDRYHLLQAVVDEFIGGAVNKPPSRSIFKKFGVTISYDNQSRVGRIIDVIRKVLG